MIKKNFFQVISFFLFGTILFILQKKFNKYLDEGDIAKILLLSILAINFCLGSILKSFSKFGLIIFCYFFLILYTVNALIVFYDLRNTNQFKLEKELKKNGKILDKRNLLEVVKYERSLGKNIYPYVVPREFLKKDRDQIHLSPLANTIYVSCNEFGEWKKIKTDKLGFNNKNFINSFDILLMGDSFAEGSCVNQSDEPSSLFKKNYNLKTYNIGVSGNGPLISLALAHEIKLLTEFDFIVWLIYDNDFYDLNVEKKSNYLTKYLNKNFTSNNYFLNKKNTDKHQKKYIEENFNSFDIGFSLKESLLELKPLIFRINKLINQKNPEDIFVYDKNLFEKIFNKMSYLYTDKEIFIVYLPETSCFTDRLSICSQRFKDLRSSSKKITFLNFFEYIKDNFKDYKEMYALRQDRAHFSALGYFELTKFISSKVQMKKDNL